jgi:uncharacterized protein
MTSESPVLLDVNLLVALAWPNHVHHAPAHEWWRARAGRRWATCPPTEFGFVRVSSNRRVFPEAKSPGEAVLLLERVVALPGHVFWPDDVSARSAELVDRGKVVGHRQVADAHLVALAIRHRGRVATFDRSLGEIVPPGADREQLVELVSAA